MNVSQKYLCCMGEKVHEKKKKSENGIKCHGEKLFRTECHVKNGY